MSKIYTHLPQSEELCLKSCDVKDAVSVLNSHITKNDCEFMSVDISSMNILDACYVSTMCSTHHFIKYPNGKINWKVSSQLVKDFTKGLELGNSEYYSV